jgi:DNA-binding NtrC family response regulator
MSREPMAWANLVPDSSTPTFVLNRRRRFLTANHAWEELTAQPATAFRGLTCTRRPSDRALSPLLRTLAPPGEVLHGQTARLQRPVPGATAGPPWWEIDFTPLALDGQLLLIFGRIRVSRPDDAGSANRLTEAQANIRAQAANHFNLDLPVPSDVEMARALSQARLAAQSRVAVGLVGEPGTGKHWLARAIHHASAVRQLPFLPLDCVHLPPEAISSVLFGPTGIGRPEGLGTLYLREPSALSRELQADLAAHLAGAGRAGVRLMAAFHNDPAVDVRGGKLLDSLYAGLNVLTIALPPLRHRLADLSFWVETLLRRAATAHGQTVYTLSPDAWQCVRAYNWPGNLRELYAVLVRGGERARGDVITPAELPVAVRQARDAEVPFPQHHEMPTLDAVLEQVERRMIRLALKRAQGNQTKAAEMLGVWRPRLLRRIKALRLDERGDPGT